ncbi:hypothetical protein Bhyg_14533 [Pseudolycoriella hygida]|uniref:Uncharacterized protein n=1 Tax=Pseudolycoriella hygida TaxID=35572 RepID=A0A9Q0MT97_9DIPT|nr:hypothetical protein Bhyg_14533 [Pseudolycoriella hygida]
MAARPTRKEKRQFKYSATTAEDNSEKLRNQLNVVLCRVAHLVETHKQDSTDCPAKPDKHVNENDRLVTTSIEKDAITENFENEVLQSEVERRSQRLIENTMNEYFFLGEPNETMNQLANTKTGNLQQKRTHESNLFNVKVNEPAGQQQFKRMRLTNDTERQHDRSEVHTLWKQNVRMKYLEGQINFLEKRLHGEEYFLDYKLHGLCEQINKDTRILEEQNQECKKIIGKLETWNTKLGEEARQLNVQLSKAQIESVPLTKNCERRLRTNQSIDIDEKKKALHSERISQIDLKLSEITSKRHNLEGRIRREKQLDDQRSASTKKSQDVKTGLRSEMESFHRQAVDLADELKQKQAQIEYLLTQLLAANEQIENNSLLVSKHRNELERSKKKEIETNVKLQTICAELHNLEEYVKNVENKYERQCLAHSTDLVTLNLQKDQIEQLKLAKDEAEFLNKTFIESRQELKNKVLSLEERINIFVYLLERQNLLPSSLEQLCDSFRNESFSDEDFKDLASKQVFEVFKYLKRVKDMALAQIEMVNNEEARLSIMLNKRIDKDLRRNIDTSIEQTHSNNQLQYTEKMKNPEAQLVPLKEQNRELQYERKIEELNTTSKDLIYENAKRNKNEVKASLEPPMRGSGSITVKEVKFSQISEEGNERNEAVDSIEDDAMCFSCEFLKILDDTSTMRM